jgi:hypothetical protein
MTLRNGEQGDAPKIASGLRAGGGNPGANRVGSTRKHVIFDQHGFRKST